MKIKFGTDGWRAVIGREYTEDNVARLTTGVAYWLKEYFPNPRVVVGFDCRFGGARFAEIVANVLDFHGVQVIYDTHPVTTPVISYAAKKYEASLGIILTASHNPPDYNGYKLKGGYGGPLLPAQIAEVEAHVPEEIEVNYWSLDQKISRKEDLTALYLEEVRRQFDLDAIRNAPFQVAYDAMYGSGQFVVRELLPDALLFRCEWNPHFYGINPEPVEKNLGEFQDYLKGQNADIALVNDGDADRIGLLDGDGNYIDSHMLLLLLIHYLHRYKGKSGKVVCGFSSSVKIAQYCKQHGLDLEVVPIGFKHICDRMLHEDVLVGGEESGGIAVQGHIPERDGIWNGLLLFQWMTETGKSIGELMDEVREIVGPFAYRRIDLKIPEELKQEIVERCKQDAYQAFGDFKVQNREDLDGWKYFLNEDEWVMIRPSGTEPVLRTYAEGKTPERAIAILEACHSTLLGPDYKNK
ncbi:phosphoglucomutase/phosphomannomutase family protein [bacterium SCSIO 12741]|nr:phosphoglucomutase/phosphomannomutase family protein [bacterium SCSIO 12741]